MKQLSVKNVVIVHGAFADASGWEPAYQLLRAHGFNVTLVQNPTSTLQADVDATVAALDRQDGPAVLVGHSWGGTVITQAGLHAKVDSLVYVAAFVPDAGESTLDLVQSAPILEVNGILPPDEKGLVYLDKEKFNATFATGQTKAKSDFMYDSQIPLTVTAFTDKVTVAAWRSKPSYAIMPTDDGTVNPVLERKMYDRAKCNVTEVTGGHTFFMNDPESAVRVILTAAGAK
ncbi:alpha/beta hydrolase [Chitinophaga filiformis]|uniref:alpha/beta hydrolase n=1 Tax=Chitinophaga filiformis TaxID=104663 RepID=UPI001F254B97|nr:alpha/beta hydrolase [Chitinophaga filiformis]MCF6402804.1 alpha/beta hydrolase [Chitinophaga filiformis]MCF6403278.1 alpha/beta hydrolase [Chitinophaga filiformis]